MKRGLWGDQDPLAPRPISVCPVSLPEPPLPAEFRTAPEFYLDGSVLLQTSSFGRTTCLHFVRYLGWTRIIPKRRTHTDLIFDKIVGDDRDLQLVKCLHVFLFANRKHSDQESNRNVKKRS